MRLTCSRARGVERFVELLRPEGASADPGERHEACLLVLVHIADESLELLSRRVVAEGFENRISIVI